ncbi:MAG: deoxyguanosinetriphosphate triphosphohydrolase, partial [Candidatus Omnitrophica bacterium]|nr:deoxyguanosinetriphosphate triphosphohydrolase [Candidatus Omnitrophota bacterium]
EGMKKHPERFKEKKTRFRTLEAEVADLADEIAYNNHDLDDGLRAELLTEEQIGKLRLWQDAAKYIRKKYPGIGPVPRKRLAIRLIVNRLVVDLVDHTLAQIERLGIRHVKDVQKTEKMVVGFSKEMAAYVREIKAFLNQNLYHHYRVERMTEKAQRFLKAIFKALIERPAQLPPEVLRRSREEGLHRAVCDYVAGMTDRFALDEYKRFFEPYERV